VIDKCPIVQKIREIVCKLDHENNYSGNFPSTIIVTASLPPTLAIYKMWLMWILDSAAGGKLAITNPAAHRNVDSRGAPPIQSCGVVSSSRTQRSSASTWPLPWSRLFLEVLSAKVACSQEGRGQTIATTSTTTYRFLVNQPTVSLFITFVILPPSMRLDCRAKARHPKNLPCQLL
jgi:hypothetical protein